MNPKRKIARVKRAPLCTCGHEQRQHIHRGGSVRFPIFTACTECDCNKYRSDGKPRTGAK